MAAQRRTYSDARSFRNALDDRLRREAQEGGLSFEHVQLRFLFERFLFRLGVTFPDRLILKGGMALELRLDRARTTQDIDLHLTGSFQRMEEELQRAAALPTGDFLVFRVTPKRDRSTIEAEGLPYGGLRFLVETQLNDKRYGRHFGLDVVFSVPMGSFSADVLPGHPRLHFMDDSPPTFRVYPLALHLAEKLHAYTMPRPASHPNSRVRDLPDMALIGQTPGHSASQLRAALDFCFIQRLQASSSIAHAIPPLLPPPPPAWADDYQRIAQETQLPWPDLSAVHQAAASFIDPVLAGVEGIWEPAAWAWR